MNLSSALLYIAPSISLLNKSVDALVRDPDIIGTYVSFDKTSEYLLLKSKHIRLFFKAVFEQIQLHFRFWDFFWVSST